MTSLARRGELVKLARVLGKPPEALEFVAPLGVTELRALREAISAQLFDDARPMLQRVATGSKLLPNALTARVGEAVFGSTLCAQIAGLLSTSHALDLALRMTDGFLAEVSASIDPRRADAVIAQIPVERIVAVAAIMVQRKDYVTLARFVDFLAPATVAAVIASIPDERELLHIGAYVESQARIRELVGGLAPERTRRMIAALRGADAVHWVEAFAIAEQLDDAQRRVLGDLAATLDVEVLGALVATAHAHDAWPAALLLVFAMSETSQRHLLELPALAQPAIVRAIKAGARALGRADALSALVALAPPALRDTYAQVA